MVSESTLHTIRGPKKLDLRILKAIQETSTIHHNKNLKVDGKAGGEITLSSSISMTGRKAVLYQADTIRKILFRILIITTEEK